MITDSDRREVARRLRAIEPDDFGSYSEEHECVEKILGIWDDCDKFLWRVVADLIEPPHQCPYYDSFRHRCSFHDVPAVESDALLALADELERPMRDGGYSKGIARRIREALGVVE